MRFIRNAHLCRAPPQIKNDQVEICVPIYTEMSKRSLKGEIPLKAAHEKRFKMQTFRREDGEVWNASKTQKRTRRREKKDQQEEEKAEE